MLKEILPGGKSRMVLWFAYQEQVRYGQNGNSMTSSFTLNGGHLHLPEGLTRTGETAVSFYRDFMRSRCLIIMITGRTVTDRREAFISSIRPWLTPAVNPVNGRP